MAKSKVNKNDAYTMKRWSSYGVQVDTLVTPVEFPYLVSIDGRGVVAKFKLRCEALVFGEALVEGMEKVRERRRQFEHA